VKVLLVGSGGREHALAAALARSPSCRELHCAPGNPGIADVATCHPVGTRDGEGLTQLAVELRCDLVVVGPEVPLVAGLADSIRSAGGVPVFGPGAEAARLEGSKAFAKDVMEAAGVPTARHYVVREVDEAERAIDSLGGACVVKADGLAAGKGVVVAEGRDEALAAARSYLSGEAHGDAGATVVIEELLVGEEVSLLALCDGISAQPLLPARDYKRIGDGDSGPNTGGMGAMAPVPGLSPDEATRLCALAHEPVLAELERRGARFSGCLYAGVMLTADGPRILEFNVRFGDPETQAILPLLEGDLAAALHAVALGLPDPSLVHVAPGACVSVVLAASGYPGAPRLGDAIDGIEEAAARDGVSVFHSGTALHSGHLVTAGGRVLAISAVAADVAAARERAYAAAEYVRFAGRQLRGDIGSLRTASRV
jgi:phosphoribosylamine---glycine ligase